MEEPLVNKEYLLQKFTGKGGWTYVEVPEVKPDKHAHFGLVKVRGTIDAHELGSFKLLPMGTGRLFFPVNAATRKKINKQAGDTVRLVLYADAPTHQQVRLELYDCLELEPAALHQFNLLQPEAQQEIIAQIAAASSDEEKVSQLVKVIERLSASGSVPAKS